VLAFSSCPRGTTHEDRRCNFTHLEFLAHLMERGFKELKDNDFSVAWSSLSQILPGDAKSFIGRSPLTSNRKVDHATKTLHKSNYRPTH
jgi:hypothetical protein